MAARKKSSQCRARTGPRRRRRPSGSRNHHARIVRPSACSPTPCPTPDLVIRTSGEHRLSNFLLWQSAYAELAVRGQRCGRISARKRSTKAIESFAGPRAALRRRQFGSGGMSAQHTTPINHAGQSHAPGFRAIRFNMDWITRPLFGFLLAVFAIAVVASGAEAFACVLALVAPSWRRANGIACVGAGEALNKRNAGHGPSPWRCAEAAFALFRPSVLGRCGTGRGGRGGGFQPCSGPGARQSPGWQAVGTSLPGRCPALALVSLRAFPAQGFWHRGGPVRHCLVHRYRRPDLRQSDRRSAHRAAAVARQDLGGHDGRQRDRGADLCGLCLGYFWHADFSASGAFRLCLQFHGPWRRSV